MGLITYVDYSTWAVKKNPKKLTSVLKNCAGLNSAVESSFFQKASSLCSVEIITLQSLIWPKLSFKSNLLYFSKSCLWLIHIGACFNSITCKRRKKRGSCYISVNHWHYAYWNFRDNCMPRYHRKFTGRTQNAKGRMLFRKFKTSLFDIALTDASFSYGRSNMLNQVPFSISTILHGKLQSDMSIPTDVNIVETSKGGG